MRLNLILPIKGLPGFIPRLQPVLDSVSLSLLPQGLPSNYSTRVYLSLPQFTQPPGGRREA